MNCRCRYCGRSQSFYNRKTGIHEFCIDCGGLFIPSRSARFPLLLRKISEAVPGPRHPLVKQSIVTDSGWAEQGAGSRRFMERIVEFTAGVSADVVEAEVMRVVWRDRPPVDERILVSMSSATRVRFQTVYY